MEENRKHERFNDFGRVECEELCHFPGTLNDISQSGLKVTFNTVIDLDMENEYKLIVRIPKCNGEYIELLVTPAWMFERNGTSQVGFSILLSAGNHAFGEYIKNLEKERDSEKEDDDFFV